MTVPVDGNNSTQFFAVTESMMAVGPSRLELDFLDAFPLVVGVSGDHKFRGFLKRLGLPWDAPCKHERGG